MPIARPLSVTLTLPPPPLSVIGGGGPESLLETVVSLTSRKRRIITNASAILNDESKISAIGSTKANHHPRATSVAFEEQIILRFSSEALANAVRASLNVGTLDTDLQIDFDKSSFTNGYFGGPATPPNATITFCGRKFKGWLVDLPSLIESLISSNKKQYYKMLIVGDEVENKTNPMEDTVPTREWPHGISPPLAFVRARRFRRQAARESLVEMSSTVRRLLEADRRALSIELELIDTPTLSLEDRNFPELEEEEDVSSIASGPLASNIGDISDDEISELAAEITYDEEDYEEEEGEEDEEEIVSISKAEESLSSDFLGSSGQHFSLLQSRIYSRLASASTAVSAKETDSFSRTNRFNDAMKILSQQSPTGASESTKLLVDDYEIYQDQEEGEEEGVAIGEEEEDEGEEATTYIHNNNKTYAHISSSQDPMGYANGGSVMGYAYGGGSEDYIPSQDVLDVNAFHSENEENPLMDYDQTPHHESHFVVAPSNGIPGDIIEVDSETPEDLIDSYTQWLYNATHGESQ